MSEIWGLLVVGYLVIVGILILVFLLKTLYPQLLFQIDDVTTEKTLVYIEVYTFVLQDLQLSDFKSNPSIEFN
jgi:hypothetical protein